MSDYIIHTETDRLKATIVSTRVRLRYPSYLSLMVTEKGSKLKLIGSSTKFEMKIAGLKSTVAGLYLAPHTLAGMGINMCPMAGACVKSCLTYSGRLPLQHKYQVLKTRAFIAYPVEFLEQLIMEIKLKAFEAHLEGYTLFIRLDTGTRWVLRLHQVPTVSPATVGFIPPNLFGGRTARQRAESKGVRRGRLSVCRRCNQGGLQDADQARGYHRRRRK